MRKARAKPGTRGLKYDKPAAQEAFVAFVAQGLTNVAALVKVQRTQKTLEMWRKDNPDFRAKHDQAKALNKVRQSAAGDTSMSFPQWRRQFLGQETYWHQLQWVDLLDGKDPRDLHPNQQYQRGKRSRILLNVPPFHAKTATLSIDYVTYRLCMDPGFRVIICSKGQGLAADILFGIKQRLTHPDYLALQKAYAPTGGWQATALEWTSTAITFGDVIRPAGEKEPNVQAIGMGGQIYGFRADLIIVDDAVDGRNVREHEKQRKWLSREVASRIQQGGKMLVVGTRIAPIDLYSELMNPENYGNGTVPWTHLASPAILDEGRTPDEHVTLWPYASRPWQEPGSDDVCDCNLDECRVGVVQPDGSRRYPRWDGNHLEIGPRADVTAAEWALVYQQSSVADDATFPEHSVRESTNSLRLPGPLRKLTPGHPQKGMHGMYVVAGCDPSVKGFAGLTVVALDRETDKRYLLQAVNMKAPTPAQLNDEMRRITELYSVNEWRVEKTGLLQFFTQNSDWRQWYATRGVRFREHFTGSNKWDPTYGVASMADLFGAYDRSFDAHGTDKGEWRTIAEPLIEIPRASSPGVRALVQQLITWTPATDPSRTPCDLVMALWFTEIGCRENLRRSSVSASESNIYRNARRYMPGRKPTNGRNVINLGDYMRPTG